MSSKYPEIVADREPIANQGLPSKFLPTPEHLKIFILKTCRTQEAYEKAVTAIFNSLDRIENIPQSTSGPYLLGSQLTEVDVRLYPTIVRFDVVYVTVHFPTFFLVDLLLTQKKVVQNKLQDNKGWIPEYPSMVAALVLGHPCFQGDDEL
jgi:glutathione S-transferase